MNLPSVLLWGFVSTVVLTTLMSAAQQLGLSRMSIPFIVGTMFTGDRWRASALGFAANFVYGWLFAFIYAFAFESVHLAAWWLGGLFGVVHGLAILVTLMPLLPSFHPRMASEERGPEPTRALEPPGFMALNYGNRTPMITLASHIIYGMILGAFYHLR
ncbi:MAG TPA: hypothetical protein VFW98_16250 [Gemmatimonadaceae bacterium]|nr:hypothetical protein [Gemmatimonadaceae bacterium]